MNDEPAPANEHESQFIPWCPKDKIGNGKKLPQAASHREGSLGVKQGMSNITAGRGRCLAAHGASHALL